jgi:hypothetical protein
MKVEIPVKLGLCLGFSFVLGCAGSLPCEGTHQCPAQSVCQTGLCVSVEDPNRPPHQSPASGDSEIPEATEDPEGADPGQDPDPLGPSSCGDLGDGVLSRNEIPDGSGQSFPWTVRASGSEAVNLVGNATVDGPVQWDLSGDENDSESSLWPLEVVNDQWFAPSFPAASHAAPLEDGSDLLGVYQEDTNALRLLGLASPTENLTLVVYDPPVEVVVYPLSVGFSRTQTVSGYGTWYGNAAFSTELTWEMHVDAQGSVITPAGIFDVLRMRTVYTNTVPLAWPPYEVVTRRIRYTHLAPCLGPVAVVLSRENEEDLLFDQADRVLVRELP